MLSKLRNLDFALLILPILLSIVGIALIYSFVFAESDSNLALKQLIFFVIGLIVMLVISMFDYRIFSSANWYLYISAIILLAIVDLIGKTSGGATRWIDLQIFQLQPSEFYKFVSVVFLASFLSRRIGRSRAVDILYLFLMLLPPLFLILIEPDLGTALVIMFSWLAVVLFSRLSIKQYVSIFASIIIAGTIFILSAYNVSPFGKYLKDYQRQRIETFLNPNTDPFGRGYNVAQAKIAIGSGGIFGQGLGRGSQSQLQFLPKPETDFIFSGYSEAFGLIGDFILLAAFLFLIIRMMDISKLAKDNFGYLLTVGIGSTFIFQIVVNIGMNVGLLPVTGIPLPFLSYGGSSLIISFVMIGVLQSIYIHRKKISF